MYASITGSGLPFLETSISSLASIKVHLMYLRSPALISSSVFFAVAPNREVCMAIYVDGDSLLSFPFLSFPFFSFSSLHFRQPISRSFLDGHSTLFYSTMV